MRHKEIDIEYNKLIDKVFLIKKEEHSNALQN